MIATRSAVLQRIAPLLFVTLWSSAFIAIRGGLLVASLGVWRVHREPRVVVRP